MPNPENDSRLPCLPQRHVVFINEFFHPDICASAVVATDHVERIQSDAGCRITVLTSNRSWDDPAKVYPPRDDDRGVRIIRVNRPAVNRVDLIRRAFGFAAFELGVLQAAKRLGRIDLIIATTAPPQGASIARKMARRCGCPYIYKVYDLYPELAVSLGRLRSEGWIHRRWLAKDTQAMRDAARVVGITEPMTCRIAATRGLPAEKLRTIHDGYDPRRVVPRGEEYARRTEPRVENRFRAESNPDGRFVVQYAGNMGLSHPFETIMDAAADLADTPDVLFQIIGDGPQRARVQERLTPGCRLIDYQPADRLGEVYATADVCLISQHETMFDMALPYKIYAILAAGKPCIFIGNRQSEIADWLEGSGAGLHVNQGDADRLARAIRELHRQPERRLAMGQAARKLFDERFHVDLAARRWADLIAEVLATAHEA